MPPINPIEPGSNNDSTVVTQVTQTTKVGYFERLGGAIKGILFGFLIFVASFAVLYWNEGRVDSSNFASSAVEISATSVNTDSNLNGKLVHLSGNLTAGFELGDDNYLKPGNYVALSRKVEVFAWVEESSTKTTNNTGGSETQETTYTYKQDWVSTPADSSKFHSPTGHTNSTKVLADNTFYARDVKVGVYSVDASTLGLPSFQAIILNGQNAIIPVATTTTPGPVENDLLKSLSASSEDIASEIGVIQNQKELDNKPSQKTELNSNYIYVTTKGFTTPTVGDIRISYTGIMSGTPVTLLGRLDGDKISAMTDVKTGKSFYRAFTGTFEDALVTLHTEYKSGLWIFRIIGFLMMWIGLGMILAPLSVLMDVLPLLGSISRGMVGLITFVVALVLSIVTILVSKILHSPIALVVAILLIVVYIFYVIKKGKSKVQEVKSS